MTTPITVDDYYQLRKIDDVQANESHLSWVEQVAVKDEKEYQRNICLYTRNLGNIRQFTRGNSDTHPRFSPAGDTLAFLSKRNGKQQIYLIKVDGGEAEKISSQEGGVISFEWSPDGKNIAFISKIDPAWKEEKPDGNVGREIYNIKHDHHEKSMKDPRVFNKMVYRTGTSYLSETKYDQLFVMDLKDRKPRQISSGNYNYSSLTWQDNETILSVSKREEPIDLNDETQMIAFNINEQSMGIVVLSYHKQYFPGAPVSDNGITILQYDLVRNKAGQNTIWGILHDNELKPINKSLNRSISTIKIRQDKIYCSVEDSGMVDIRIYDKNHDTFTTITRDISSVLSFDCVSDEIFFIGTDPLHPYALWRWNDGEITLIHDPNANWLKERKIIKPEEFWLENPEGIRFQGWFFDAEGENTPLILSVHGGPHAMWTGAGSMWHEWQVSLASGYSVLAINPIGSGGYGEEFSQVITARWGIDDARDLIQGVNYFRDRVDTNRIYITGGSYAGFQVANMVARYDIFKAACAQRGVYNLCTFWATTDIPMFGFNEMGTTPWDNLDLMWDISPISRVSAINTPLLLIHSENDFRVSISQAEELFASLRYHSKEVEFVRYPRDGHELSRSGEPSHVVDRIRRMLRFFEDHS